MSDAGPLLLLDLDGVVVFEAAPPQLEKLEILRLHDLLGEVLTRLGLPVVVLTHRSRAEAERILHSAGVGEAGRGIAGVMAAEDLFRAALRHGNPWQLLRRGLKKSWILPVVEARFGVPRARIAFIDDRLDNLEDLLAHGIGLALHAPSAIAADGSSLTSFDLEQALGVLREWNGGPRVPHIVPIAPRSYAVEPWRRTGLDTSQQGRHAFNVARVYGRNMRRLLSWK